MRLTACYEVYRMLGGPQCNKATMSRVSYEAHRKLLCPQQPMRPTAYYKTREVTKLQDSQHSTKAMESYEAHDVGRSS